MSSESRQTTPSKRRRDSLVMTDELVSVELQMPKLGKKVDAGEITKINKFVEKKCLHCIFMGRDFKFEVNIAHCTVPNMVPTCVLNLKNTLEPDSYDLSKIQKIKKCILGFNVVVK
jgi:hypothetical protein